MYQIEVNGRAYELVLDENRTVKEIIHMMPLTISMQPYSNIEYYGTLPHMPFFDDEAATMQAEKNRLMYCREYNALVVVCKRHHDIFREIPIGTIKGDISLTFGADSRVAMEIKEVREK